MNLPSAMNQSVTETTLKIGVVASLSGLSIKTIRYYDELGLLEPEVERSQTGYRLFHDRVLNRLNFIKQAQSLGLSLTDIKVVLSVHDRGELPCAQIKQRLQDQVVRIDQKIHDLQVLRSNLQTILAQWADHPATDLRSQIICPNLQSEHLAQK
jgi:DNA-binding transcriptional MerR regulator